MYTIAKCLPALKVWLKNKPTWLDCYFKIRRIKINIIATGLPTKNKTFLKGTVKEKWKGYRLKPENLRSWTISIRHLVSITSPELQPMAVQYTGHEISLCITWQRYCTAIGGSSGDVIRTICNNIINYIYQKRKIKKLS